MSQVVQDLKRALEDAHVCADAPVKLVVEARSVET